MRSSLQRVSSVVATTLAPVLLASTASMSLPQWRRKAIAGQQRGSLRRRPRRTAGVRRGTRGKLTAAFRRAVTYNPAKHTLFSDVAGTPPGAQALSFANIVNTGNMLLLNGKTRGDTVQDRTGDFTFTTKIWLNGILTFGTGFGGDGIAQWMLIYQRETRGVALTAATFLADYYGTATYQDNGIPNTNNRQLSRYRILKKGHYHMKEAIAGVIELRKINIKWMGKGLRTSYTLGNAGTAADIDDGALYFLIWQGYAGPGVNGMGFNAHGNVYYHDQG